MFLLPFQLTVHLPCLLISFVVFFLHFPSSQNLLCPFYSMLLSMSPFFATTVGRQLRREVSSAKCFHSIPLRSRGGRSTWLHISFWVCRSGISHSVVPTAQPGFWQQRLSWFYCYPGIRHPGRVVVHMYVLNFYITDDLPYTAADLSKANVGAWNIQAVLCAAFKRRPKPTRPPHFVWTCNRMAVSQLWLSITIQLHPLASTSPMPLHTLSKTFGSKLRDHRRPVSTFKCLISQFQNTFWFLSHPWTRSQSWAYFFAP